MKMLNKTGLSNDPWDTPLIPTRLCTIDRYPSFQSTSVSSARPHFKSFSMRTLWIPYRFTNTGSQYLPLTLLYTRPNREQKNNIQKEDSKDIRRDELQILEESLRLILLAGKKNIM